MKYLLLTITLLSLSVHATKPKEPPPNNQDQQQTQGQDQNQNQHQTQSSKNINNNNSSASAYASAKGYGGQGGAGGSVGAITNEMILNQQQDFVDNVNQQNKQLVGAVDYLDCNIDLGYQELDGAAYSVATVGLCVGYEDYNDSGAVSAGILYPFVSRGAKAAFRTKARNLERQGSDRDLVEKLTRMIQDQNRQVGRLVDKVNQLEAKTEQK